MLQTPLCSGSQQIFTPRRIHSTRDACLEGTWRVKRAWHHGLNAGCLPFTTTFRKFRLESKWYTTFNFGSFQWKISGSNGTSGERLPFEWNYRWIFFGQMELHFFSPKKTERIEPYHLIRSFGCKCFPAPLSSKARIMKAKLKHNTDGQNLNLSHVE